MPDHYSVTSSTRRKDLGHGNRTCRGGSRQRNSHTLPPTPPPPLPQAKDKPVAKTSQPTILGDPHDRSPEAVPLPAFLASQNIEGQKAEEHLKSYFEVSRLCMRSEPGWPRRSYIDNIVKDRKMRPS